MSILQLSAAEFEKLLLLIVRLSGILVIAPIFGHRNVPAIVKIGLVIITSLIVLPTIAGKTVEVPSDLPGLVVMLFKEVVAGLAIGFGSMMIFLAVQFAGTMIGLQMGFGIVNVIDPNSQLEVPIIGQFQLLLAMLIFLALDGHHMVLSAIVSSVKIIPLGAIDYSSLSGELILRAGIETLASGIKLGAPCMVTLFLVDVALGVVARTMPQMNVFVVGFPLKIATGFVMIAASLPIFGYVFGKLLSGLDGNLSALILAMKPTP